MNSTILSICVALAIIILSEGKYLLVSVEESGVSRLQSRNAYQCDDEPGIGSNNVELKRIFKDIYPGYTTEDRRIYSCAPRALVDKHPTQGNYIAFEVIPQPGDLTETMGTLNIVSMKHIKCKKASRKCQCDGMLTDLFDHVQREVGSGLKIHESVRNITIPTDMTSHANFLGTCTCLLQAALKFRYFDVHMPEGQYGCQTPQSINGPTTNEVCGYYRANNCYNNRIVVSKEIKDDTK